MIAGMAQVHPTAFVDEASDLAADAVVGPWCSVEGAVRIGSGTRLLERVSIRGPVTIGAGNVFYPGACIGFAPQDRKFDPSEDGAGVAIGDRNVLREGVTIHRATGGVPTTVGDDNFLMVNSHLGHDTVIGSWVTMGNGTLLAGHVEIADRVIFGGNATVHQFCRVGRMAMFSGLQGVTQDVPPFCVVYNSREIGSLNMVGLRRGGLREHVKPLRRAFDLLLRTRLPRPIALQRIRNELGDDPLCVEFADFAEGSKRGICPYGGSRGDDTITDD